MESAMEPTFCSKYYDQIVSLTQVDRPGSPLWEDLDYWRCKAGYSAIQFSNLKDAQHRLLARLDQQILVSERYEWALIGLAVFGFVVLLRMWGKRRRHLFQIRQLHLAAQATRDTDRQALAKIETRVEDEFQHSQTLGSWFALDPGRDVPLAETVIAVRELGQFVIKWHEPREQLALDRERQDMELVKRESEIQQDLKAEIPRFNRELNRLYHEHQQARWDTITKELTEVRKVVVGAVEEFRNNPGFQDKLKYILDTFGDFERAMRSARDEGTLSDNAVGKLLDTMMTDAFHHDVKDRTGASAKPNGR